MTLRNKNVLITGAGRGIGAAAAKLLAASGARVALISRTASEIRGVARDITTKHGKALACVGDVSQETDVKEAFETVRKTWGPVDILVNNAGILVKSPLTDHTAADWDRVLSVNLKGAFLCSREAFRHMKRSKKGGTIINVSSLSGIRGVEKFPGMTSYIASKHGLIGLTEGLAVEGKPFGIRVNAIAPGAVNTRMLRENAPGLKACATAKDIADVILFLCESYRFSGSVLEILSNDGTPK